MGSGEYNCGAGVWFEHSSTETFLPPKFGLWYARTTACDHGFVLTSAGRLSDLQDLADSNTDRTAWSNLPHNATAAQIRAQRLSDADAWAAAAGPQATFLQGAPDDARIGMHVAALYRGSYSIPLPP